MMKTLNAVRIVAIGLILGFLAIAQEVVAQVEYRSFPFDTTKVYEVELVDGTRFIGQFLSKTEDVVYFKTSSIQRLEISFEQIRSIKELVESEAEEALSEEPKVETAKRHSWYPNPNATRYFFAPSAFNLKKREGYYQNSYLILNSVNYGVTDHFSVGASLELLSTFSSIASGSFEPIFLVTPKVGWEVHKDWNVGAGILYLSLPGFDDDEGYYDEYGNYVENEDSKRSSAGIAYGIATYGDIERNVTLGLGWGFFEGDIASQPIITLNGMIRVRENMSLVTENWFIPFGEDFEVRTTYYELMSYGVRFFGKKLSVDLGFLNNRDLAKALIIGIPYVDFVVKF
jgi:hypothetical protein